MSDHSFESPNGNENEIRFWTRVLDEGKQGFKWQLDSIEAIKASARSILQISSLLLSIQILVQGWSPIKVDWAIYQWLPPGFFLLSYLGQIFIVMKILSPKEISGPIRLNYDVLVEHFWYKSDLELLQKESSAYLNIIEINKKVMIKMSKWYSASNVCFFIMILSMASMWVLTSIR